MIQQSTRRYLNAFIWIQGNNYFSSLARHILFPGRVYTTATSHHRFIDWLVHLNVPALGVEQLSPDLWRDQVVDLVPQELEQGLLLFSAKLKWTFLLESKANGAQVTMVTKFNAILCLLVTMSQTKSSNHLFLKLIAFNKAVLSQVLT